MNCGRDCSLKHTGWIYKRPNKKNYIKKNVTDFLKNFCPCSRSHSVVIQCRQAAKPHPATHSLPPQKNKVENQKSKTAKICG